MERFRIFQRFFLKSDQPGWFINVFTNFQEKHDKRWIPTCLGIARRFLAPSGCIDSLAENFWQLSHMPRVARITATHGACATYAPNTTYATYAIAACARHTTFGTCATCTTHAPTCYICQICHICRWDWHIKIAWRPPHGEYERPKEKIIKASLRLRFE